MWLNTCSCFKDKDAAIAEAKALAETHFGIEQNEEEGSDFEDESGLNTGDYDCWLELNAVAHFTQGDGYGKSVFAVLETPLAQ